MAECAQLRHRVDQSYSWTHRDVIVSCCTARFSVLFGLWLSPVCHLASRSTKSWYTEDFYQPAANRLWVTCCIPSHMDVTDKCPTVIRNRRIMSTHATVQTTKPRLDRNWINIAVPTYVTYSTLVRSEEDLYLGPRVRNGWRLVCSTFSLLTTWLTALWTWWRSRMWMDAGARWDTDLVSIRRLQVCDSLRDPDPDYWPLMSTMATQQLRRLFVAFCWY